LESDIPTIQENIKFCIAVDSMIVPVGGTAQIHGSWDSDGSIVIIIGVDEFECAETITDEVTKMKNSIS
jgi:hypothetical protein